MVPYGARVVVKMMGKSGMCKNQKINKYKLLYGVQRSTNVLKKHTLENIKNLKHNQTLPKQSENIQHKAAQESGSWIQCLYGPWSYGFYAEGFGKKLGPFSPSLRVASDCARLDAAHSIRPFENPT